MTEKVVSKDRELFRLAFELAYFIHAHREIAFFIAEDSLEGLASLVGYQKKNRAPSEGLRGFWKWGERTRPVRKTLILDESQMLQWLVYKQSQYWERQTEDREGLYLPSEDDLLVRYIEHLVFLSFRRGSFYVTLAVCALLHHFDRRETRLFYDVLTQSDVARMKDTNYIGKQRLELFDKILLRFNGMIETVKNSGNEKQFFMRPAAEWATTLVTEGLRRFTPWGTTCVVGPGFEITDIPDLFFPGPGCTEEDLIEMNRIHTVLHPGCLAKFTKGLSEYVRSLPDDDQDKGCNFDAHAKRLVLPQFSNFEAGPSGRDRFQPPTLTSEDYIRLQRTLDARGHRKKTFVPQKLSVYIDGVPSYSFAPGDENGISVIPGETSFIEVRGEDARGEVMLALIVLNDLPVTAEGFENSIVHSGGQKVSVKLKPFVKSDNSKSTLHLEIAYEQRAKPVLGVRHQATAQLKNISNELNHSFSFGLSPKVAFFRKAIIVTMFVLFSVLLIWQFQTQTEMLEKAPDETVTVVSPAPTPATKPSQTGNDAIVIAEVKEKIASARWSKNPESALNATPIELTRAATPSLDFSRRQSNLTLGLPVYDDRGRPYSRYRLTISVRKNHLWRQTLIAPKVSLTGYAHILDCTLVNRLLRKNVQYDVHVEGISRDGWRPIGYMTFKRQ